MKDFGDLLHDLCVRLGFCLPPDDIVRILADPPLTVDAFTDAVVEAEGFDPATCALRGQVREMVADFFGEPSRRPTRYERRHGIHHPTDAGRHGAT